MRKKKGGGGDHLYMKPDKYSILVNIKKKKQTHRYTKQSSGYQYWGIDNTGMGDWKV